MSRRTRSIIIVVVVLALICLAYPGAAWLIGLQTQSLLGKREQQAMSLYGANLRLMGRQYQRGVFGATEQLTYGFAPSAAGMLAALPGASALAAMQLTVRNTIHHGPLPQLRTVALATMDTEVVLPPAVGAKLRVLLGGEPAVQIHTRLGWFGGTTTAVRSAGYEGQLADGSRLSWRGVEFKGSANSGLASLSSDASVDSLGLESSRMHLQMDGLHVHADLKRAFELLYTGPFELKIARLQWQPPAPSRQFLAQGISIDASSTASGDYYTSGGELNLDSLETSGVTVEQAGYTYAVEHLYGPGLAALIRDMRAAQKGTSAAALAPASMLQGAVKDDAIGLLLHEPVLNITRIGFAMPEGELRMSARLSAPGLKQADVDGPQMQLALIQHLNAAVDVRIDTALATRLLNGSGRKDALAGQIDALERQGYIKREGKALVTHLTFSGGKIALNGQPYPPMPTR